MLQYSDKSLSCTDLHRDSTTSFHILSRAGIEWGSLTASFIFFTKIAKVGPSHLAPAVSKTFFAFIFALTKAISSSTPWLNELSNFSRLVLTFAITSFSVEGGGSVLHSNVGKHWVSVLHTATFMMLELSSPSTYVVRNSVGVSSFPFLSGILTSTSRRSQRKGGKNLQYSSLFSTPCRTTTELAMLVNKL